MLLFFLITTNPNRWNCVWVHACEKPIVRAAVMTERYRSFSSTDSFSGGIAIPLPHSSNVFQGYLMHLVTLWRGDSRVMHHTTAVSHGWATQTKEKHKYQPYLCAWAPWRHWDFNRLFLWYKFEASTLLKMQASLWQLSINKQLRKCRRTLYSQLKNRCSLSEKQLVSPVLADGSAHLPRFMTFGRPLELNYKVNCIANKLSLTVIAISKNICFHCTPWAWHAP